MGKLSIQDSAVFDVNDVLESIRQQQRDPRSSVTGHGVVQMGSAQPLQYGFVVESSGADGPRLRLHYTLGAGAGRAQTETTIPLKSNQPGFGGTRWWLSCPSCAQRRARLYLVPNAKQLACKKCHNIV